MSETRLLVQYFKVLSRNDTGETHSHQSGITINKAVAKTKVFPFMGIETLNPTKTVTFYDEMGEEWSFQYKYYNDVFHGKERSKSHNEYRLTCVIDYLRKVHAKSGDNIWFGLDIDGKRRIGLIKATMAISPIPTIPTVEPKKDASSYEFSDDPDMGAEEFTIFDPDAATTPTIIKIDKNWSSLNYGK